MESTTNGVAGSRDAAEEFFKPKSIFYDDGQAEGVLSDHLDIWVRRQVAQQVAEQSANLKRAARQVVRSLSVLMSVAPDGAGYAQMVADLVSYNHWDDAGDAGLMAALENARERNGAIHREMEAQWEASREKPRRRPRG